MKTANVNITENVEATEVGKTIETVKAKKVTKKTMDTIFAEIISLKESKKAIDARLKELVDQAEALYKKSPAEREVISGNIYEMSKVPINRGRNTYSPEVVHGLITKVPVEQRAGLIIVKEEVDPKVMDSLIKAGYLTSADADAARVNKWTYSSKFSKKASAVIDGNIISFEPKKKNRD